MEKENNDEDSTVELYCEEVNDPPLAPCSTCSDDCQQIVTGVLCCHMKKTLFNISSGLVSRHLDTPAGEMDSYIVTTCREGENVQESTDIKDESKGQSVVTPTHTKTHLESLLEELGLKQYYREKLSLSRILEIDKKTIIDEPAKCKSDLPWYFLKKGPLQQHPSKMAANSSSTGSKSSNSSGGKQSGPSAEQVVATFQRMRQEQRSMASKAAELEMDINEHSLVIDTLKEVDPSRKCFRLIGGVLVERTVKEVLPALENNKEQISKIIESINSQMQAKGRELTEYRERYNIRLVGEGEGEEKGQSAAPSRDSEGGASKSGAGVLVS